MSKRHEAIRAAADAVAKSNRSAPAWEIAVTAIQAAEAAGLYADEWQELRELREVMQAAVAGTAEA